MILHQKFGILGWLEQHWMVISTYHHMSWELSGNMTDLTPHTLDRPIEEEFNSPVLPEMQKYLTDEEYSVAVGFYILLRAFDRFAANYNTFPRQFDGAMDEEISRLRTTSVSLLIDLGCNGSTLTKDLINEMCRYGAAELHAVAAYVGGVASQEIIKLITKQFVPMTGTFIFNGIDHKSQLLSL